MNSFKELILLIFLFAFFVYTATAQASDEVEMADAFRSDGKIYIVVAVLSVVFIGIVALLVGIDRKVSNLEKKVKERNN